MPIDVTSLVKIRDPQRVATDNRDSFPLQGDVSGLVMYGDVQVIDPTMAGHCVKILRVVDKSNAVVSTFPSLLGMVFRCAEANLTLIPPGQPGHLSPDEEVLALIAEGDERKKAFGRLRKYDRVVLLNGSSSQGPPAVLRYYFANEELAALTGAETILARVEDTSERDTLGLVQVKLRPVALANGTVKALTPRKVLADNGLPEDVKIKLRLTDVRPAAFGDEIANVRGLNFLDLLAIKHPALFMSKIAGYDWDVVKKLYKTSQDPSKANDPKQLHFGVGGMDALLDYREWLLERVLTAAADVAEFAVTAQRTEMAFSSVALNERTSIDELNNSDRNQFISSGQRLTWGWGGSTDATSDIDVNTNGDGTEWAVRAANFVYGLIHNRREAGSVWDVNVYARDFLPWFQPTFKGRTKATADFMTPVYLHAYDAGHQQQIKADLDTQRQAAWLHVRRHFGAAAWEKFRYAMKQAVDGEAAQQQVDGDAAAVEEEYRHHMYLLAQSIAKLAARNNVQLKAPDPNMNGAQLDDWLSNPAIPAYLRMAAENRVYEKLLTAARTGVGPLRVAFDWSKARLVSAPSPEGSLATDNAYLQFRQQLSRAVFFANESYGTEGSLVEVVAGKQYFSRGVAADRLDKVKCNNIRYSIHQLYQSMSEQFGDIHKTAKKTYVLPDKPTQADITNALGLTLIACGKYLHRYFNCMKYLYSYRQYNDLVPVSVGYTEITQVLKFLNDREDSGALVLDYVMAPLAFPDVLLKDAIPKGDRPRLFDDLRVSCGSGLEMLKKLSASLADVQKPDSNYARAVAAKLHVQGDGAAMFAKQLWPQVAVETARRCFAYLKVDPVTDLDSLKYALLLIHGQVTRDYLAYRPGAKAPPLAFAALGAQPART